MPVYICDVVRKNAKPFFGENLKSLRLQRGLTQSELGGKTGLSKRMIIHYEKHATRPPADKVAVLAKALGVKLDVLVNGSCIKGPEDLDPKFSRRLEKARKLPKGDRMVLSTMIDTLLKKNKKTE